MNDDEIIPEEEGAPETPDVFEPIDEQLAEHRARVEAAKKARKEQKKSPPQEP